MTPLKIAFQVRKALGIERYEWSSDWKNGEHFYTVRLKKIGRILLPVDWWSY